MGIGGARCYRARTRKPIFAATNSLAASGAYWIGSAVTEFYATPGGEASASLMGAGFSGPHHLVNPSSLVFPATTIGTASTAMRITVGWSGGQASGPLATSLSGSAAGDLHVDADTCTGTSFGSGVGSSCTIDLSFRPTAAGTRQATMMVTATPGGTAAVAIAGEGM